MEEAIEVGADRSDRAFGVKNLDAETALSPSTESKIGKLSQLSDHKSQGCVSNVLVDLPRVNKGVTVRGEWTTKNMDKNVDYMFLPGKLFIHFHHIICYW